MAKCTGTTLNYIHQDHLSGTSVVSDSAGALISSTSYAPYGDRLESQGTMPTDKLFTGQRLDSTGLYYYREPAVGPTSINPSVVAYSPLTVSGLWSGRYYDPSIGRFVSSDTLVPDLYNPQSLNRYSYALNRPLVGRDVDGHFLPIIIAALANPWIRGAVVGAVSYTVTKAVVSLVTEESFTESWSWRDFGEAAALGAATGGLGTWGTVTKAIGEAAPVAIGAIGSEAQYLVDIAEGQTQLSPAKAMGAALLGGMAGAVEIGFRGNTGLEAAGIGILSGTSSSVAGELLPVEASTNNYDYYDYSYYDYGYDYYGFDYGYSDYNYYDYYDYYDYSYYDY